MKVLYFPSYPHRDASSRHRVYIYKKYLEQLGNIITISPPSSEFLFNIFYKFVIGRPDREPRKSLYRIIRYLYYLKIFCKRIFIIILKSKKFDIIVVHRSLIPPGIGFLERLLIKHNSNVVYDFDDALFEFPQNKKNMPLLLGKIKCIIAGNSFLKNYAVQYNNNVYLLPTCVEVSKCYPKSRQKTGNIVIGWIGNPVNLRHLNIVRVPLGNILERYDKVRIKIVCDGQPYIIDPKFDDRIESVPWSLEQEIELIDSFDIGIMPLTADRYSEGKCGFKLIQYMAMKKAVVCTPLGINAKIVEHGIEGFHALDEWGWERHIEELIINKLKREEIGRKGRRKVEKEYSVEGNVHKLDSILRRCNADLVENLQKVGVS